jgi:hypothetical protein
MTISYEMDSKEYNSRPREYIVQETCGESIMDVSHIVQMSKRLSVKTGK